MQVFPNRTRIPVITHANRGVPSACLLAGRRMSDDPEVVQVITKDLIRKIRQVCSLVPSPTLGRWGWLPAYSKLGQHYVSGPRSGPAM